MYSPAWDQGFCLLTRVGQIHEIGLFDKSTSAALTFLSIRLTKAGLPNNMYISNLYFYTYIVLYMLLRLTLPPNISSFYAYRSPDLYNGIDREKTGRRGARRRCCRHNLDQLGQFPWLRKHRSIGNLWTGRCRDRIAG